MAGCGVGKVVSACFGACCGVGVGVTGVLTQAAAAYSIREMVNDRACNTSQLICLCANGYVLDLQVVCQADPNSFSKMWAQDS